MAFCGLEKSGIATDFDKLTFVVLNLIKLEVETMFLNLEKLRKEFKEYRKIDDDISSKIDILITVTKFEMAYSGPDQAETKKKKFSDYLKGIQLSLRTLQRFKKNYIEGGPVALGKKIASGRPAGELPCKTKLIIENYREKYRWGSEVIQAHLKHDHNIEISRHKIERYLTLSGLRKIFPCTTIKKQRAQKKKKHTQKVIVLHPGLHTQMDVKYQLHLLKNKEKCYVYNFIDHSSNWSFKYPYAAINEKNTQDFMERLIKICPFQIFRLQTDNGIEFTFKFISAATDEPKEHLLKKFCDDHKINHKLIPPGEKELQGLVERSHRQDDQELYTRIKPDALEAFKCLLNEFVEHRNSNRRFKKLGWKTPNQWLENYLVVLVAYDLQIKNNASEKEATIIFFPAEKNIDYKKTA